ncbi:MAG: RNA polymerase sigma factor, partial [Solirubrobacterales bacterium]|nr:RNA polymerase sigma factor [Solirubrobacterales bacterium]
MGASMEIVDRTGAAVRAYPDDVRDDELVALVRVGDDAAFETIYDRHARGVLAFCAHMLGSRDDAEDALQLVFVSAYRALRSTETAIALRPWLYTIARNRCLSELRNRRDCVASHEPLIERLLLDSPADEVERREELREMVQEIQRLPPDQRAALVLFELGDHSHGEIAAVLDVPREKIKALVFQARETLMRTRRARESPCAEIRERVATLRGKILPRSLTRAHIDRCPGCAAFEREVHRQRFTLALVLPVALTSELKASVLGSALSGGGIAGVGAGGSGGAVGIAGAGGGSGVAAGGGGGMFAGGTALAGGGAAAGGGGGATGAAAAATASAGTIGAGGAS